MKSSGPHRKDTEMLPVRVLPKAALVLYLFTLLWLVFFKFSFNLSTVLSNYHMSGLNLIPFAGSSLRDTLDNFVVFIPFGLLLTTNIKQIDRWRKLALIASLSLAVEVTQFVLAIGSTDITDVITNIFGGFIGLLLYEFVGNYIDNEKLDKFIAATTVVLVVLFLLLRIFFFRARYHSAH
jgi:glycopeptide antibiotics resistance protein